MKWFLTFSQKTGTAVILVILILGVLASALLEKRVTPRNNFTVSSLFADRLKPSVNLYEMRSLNEQFLFVVEEYLHTNNADDRKRLNDKMLNLYQKFSELLMEYKATLLIEEEQKIVNQVYKDLKNVDTAFAAIDVSGIKEEALKTTKASITLMNEKLRALNKIQIKIGEESLARYKRDSYYISFLNTVQILLSVLIGIVMLRMVLSSRWLPKADEENNLD